MRETTKLSRSRREQGLRHGACCVDLRSLGASSQRACLEAGQGLHPPDRRVALPQRSVPLGLQCPVGGAARLGSTPVRATARSGTLPCEASLVLVLSSEPGRFFRCVALGRTGHGYTEFRWYDVALGFP